MKHEHCEHKDLNYCKLCDVTYCSCGKEWGNLTYTPMASFTINDATNKAAKTGAGVTNDGGNITGVTNATGTNIIFHTHKKVAQTS